MYFLVILLPLLSSLIIGFGGFYIGRKNAAFFSVSLLFLAWVCALFIFWEVCIYQNIVSIKLYQWLLLDIYNITFGFLFDVLSSSMLVVVLTISMLVHLYSTTYMSHDPYLIRFMSYLSLFTVNMLILITSDILYNYLSDEKGWVYVHIY